MESPVLPSLMQNLRSRIEATVPVVRMGEVVQVTGLVIESIGPNVSLGDICEISSPRLSGLQAEVVGFRDHRVLLMPLGEMQDIHAGCQVAATGRAAGSTSAKPSSAGSSMASVARLMEKVHCLQGRHALCTALHRIPSPANE